MKESFTHLLTREIEHLSFESISHICEEGATLRVIVHGSKNETDLLIFPQSTVTRYQIDFPSYVSYSVTFEDYTTLNEVEQFKGHAFRIYSKSHYFDMLQKFGNVQREIRGKTCVHYAWMCAEHVVNVISFDEPSIYVSQVDSQQE